MKKKILWRLGNLPTPEEIRGLVTDGLLTKDEAREILFNEKDETKRDAESLEAEIKFLRELVQKLSARSTIVEQIRYIEKPYQIYPWWGQYQTYCSSGSNQLQTTMAGATMLNTVNLTADTMGNSAQFQANWSAPDNFTDIQTF